MFHLIATVLGVHNDITIVGLQIIEFSLKIDRIHKISILDLMALIQFLVDLGIINFQNLVLYLNQLLDMVINNLYHRRNAAQ